jgi:tetraacyldisaccharide 4'-kinase
MPAISVGNLTFGGTGKTPTVVALVRDLVRRGRRPAVLTRGYGRRGDGQAVVTGPQPRQAAAEVGDEPVELAGRLPGVPIVVDADRLRGGREAGRLGADVVVLDDGFQHLRIARDLDVVLIDAGDPWGGGHLPPRGRLREPVSALHRADAVIISKVPTDWHTVAEEIERTVHAVAPQALVMAARMAASRVQGADREWLSADDLRGRRVVAFAGIGRPGGLLQTLREAGAEVVDTRWFPDHHRYADRDLEAVLQMAAAAGAVPLTTLKDAVKLPADAPVWRLEADMVPVAGSWDGLWRLLVEEPS